MSTLEKTISMMENLPEPDLLLVQDLIKQLFQQHEYETVDYAVGTVLKPMSKDDFLKDIETAEQEIASGQYRTAEEVFAAMDWHKPISCGGNLELL